MAPPALDDDWETVHTPQASGGDEWETVHTPQAAAPASDFHPMPLIPTTREEATRAVSDLRSFGRGLMAAPAGVMQLGLRGASYLGVPGAKEAGQRFEAAYGDIGQQSEDLRREAYGSDYDPARDPMAVAGNLANPLPWKTAGLLSPGASFLSRLGRTTAAGAAIGAEQPVEPGASDRDYWKTKGLQALLGGGIGAGTEIAGGTVAPWLTDQAQQLLDRYGIRVPFGASLGKLPGRVEQISQSVPASGMAVRGAYDTANEDLVRAGNNEALAPLRPYGFFDKDYTPESATQPGRDMARERGDTISKSYEDVIPRLKGVVDQQLVQDIENIRATLPSRVQGDFDDAVQRNLYAKAAHPQQPPGSPFTTGGAGRPLTPQELIQARAGAQNLQAPGAPGAPGAAAAVNPQEQYRALYGDVPRPGVPTFEEWQAQGMPGVTPAAPAAPAARPPVQGPVREGASGDEVAPITFKPVPRPEGQPGDQMYNIYRGKQYLGTTTSRNAVGDFNTLNARAGELPQVESPSRPATPTRKTGAALDQETVAEHTSNLQGAGTDLGSFQDAYEQLTRVKAPELRAIYRAYAGQSAGRMTKADLLEGIKSEFANRNLKTGPALNGQDAKYADMDLRDEAINRIQNPRDTDDRYLGRALGEVRGKLREMWTRYSDEGDIAQLNATDDAYSMHKILEKAATSSAAPEGMFGPTQLWQAVKSQDATLGKRALDRGEAKMQDLADSAKTVLGKTVADSGTPERSALMAATGGLTGVGIAGLANPAATVGALATHALAYTRPGQTVLRTLAGGRELFGGSSEMRQAIGQGIKATSPGMAALTAARQPYDNKPRSVREWQAEAQKRQAAAQAAQQYYGLGAAGGGGQ